MPSFFGGQTVYADLENVQLGGTAGRLLEHRQVQLQTRTKCFLGNPLRPPGAAKDGDSLEAVSKLAVTGRVSFEVALLQISRTTYPMINGAKCVEAVSKNEIDS